MDALNNSHAYHDSTGRIKCDLPGIYSPDIKMSMQEIHGIFQFADDLFLEEGKEERPVLPQYQAKFVYPRVRLRNVLLNALQWFIDAEAVDSSDSPDEASKSCYTVKYKLDLLYYEGRFDEACRVGEAILSRGNCRRETFEAVLRAAVRADRRELAERMLVHLESLEVQDAGLAYVLEQARRDLKVA